MIVPEYWAESRKQLEVSGKQITVRRYGWSDVSEADALTKAHARVEDALQRIISGEKLNKREPKVAYNGADGVPIREEILARHGKQVITRNGYGAHCLNSPNVLFADIDFETEFSAKLVFVVLFTLCIASATTGILLRSFGAAFGLLFASLFVAVPLANQVIRLAVAIRGGHERIAHKRIADFLSKNPSWNVRLYRSPAGYRLLVTHQEFDAASEDVMRFFSAVSADPVYVRMCTNQRCFRARLSAKPWRIGISTHMRPRPGVWPVQPERIAIRNEWIEKYEAVAAAFSACRYIESLGSGIVHPAIQPVIELHDRESRALLNDTKLA